MLTLCYNMSRKKAIKERENKIQKFEPFRWLIHKGLQHFCSKRLHHVCFGVLSLRLSLMLSVVIHLKAIFILEFILEFHFIWLTHAVLRMFKIVIEYFRFKDTTCLFFHMLP